jgi:hypothetical protein
VRVICEKYQFRGESNVPRPLYIGIFASPLIAADTVVIFFTLALVERRNPSNSNNIRDVINYLKKEFRLERDIFSHSRGVAILFSENFNYNISDITRDIPGRKISCKINVSGL